MAKAPDWNGSDSEGRKRGEQTVLGQNPIQTNPGLDTPLVHAVNDALLVSHNLRGSAVP